MRVVTQPPVLGQLACLLTVAPKQPAGLQPASLAHHCEVSKSPPAAHTAALHWSGVVIADELRFVGETWQWWPLKGLISQPEALAIGAAETLPCHAAIASTTIIAGSCSPCLCVFAKTPITRTRRLQAAPRDVVGPRGVTTGQVCGHRDGARGAHKAEALVNTLFPPNFTGAFPTYVTFLRMRDRHARFGSVSCSCWSCLES